MKVAIVHELLVKLGGAERVAKVLADMYPEAPIFTLLYDEKKVGTDFPRARVVTPSFLQRLFSWGIPRRVLIGKMPRAIEDFDFSEYDLVLSSSSAFAHGVLTGDETKHICYCHSPARYLWDQTFSVQEQQSRRGFLAPLKSFFLPRLFHTLRLWDRVAADRPTLLLANAHTVKKRISHFWGQKSEVVFPPVRTTLFHAQKHHENYFLIVSALSPYKNIDIAVKAFTALPKHTLLIIGEGSERAYLEGLAGKNVEFLGRKSDESVRQYLQNCRGLIFPSLDDFGIVPVEAMACGKPVIALKKGGVTETVVDGKTGIFFPDATPENLTTALLAFFKAEDSFSAEDIANHADQFSEAVFVKKIQATIAKVMKQKSF